MCYGNRITCSRLTMCNSLFEIKIALWTVRCFFFSHFISARYFPLFGRFHPLLRGKSEYISLPMPFQWWDIKKKNEINEKNTYIARSEHNFCRFYPIFIRFYSIFASSFCFVSSFAFDIWNTQFLMIHFLFERKKGFFQYIAFPKQLSPFAQQQYFMATQFDDLEFLWPNTSKI